jgi:hypothetical protein
MLDAGGPYFKFVDPGGVNGIPSPLFPAHWGSLDEYWFLFLVVKHIVWWPYSKCANLNDPGGSG